MNKLGKVQFTTLVSSSLVGNGEAIEASLLCKTYFFDKDLRETVTLTDAD